VALNSFAPIRGPTSVALAPSDRQNVHARSDARVRQEDAMPFTRIPRLRFSLRSVFILMLGVAIGYSLNLRTWQLLAGPGSEARKLRPSSYIIEPPDVLRVQVAGETRDSPAAFSGDCLVGMDGKINLGSFGSLYVAGLTVEEAREKISTVVAEQMKPLRVIVNIVSSNSKVYYVVVKGGSGDNVIRAPITGNDTALDAIAQVGGLEAPDATEIWIARPASNGIGGEQILPVNWDEISRGAVTTTNYQILPGDRVFVSKKRSASATK
jgi:protein involved in polysaccharide export with SLBB domain